MWACSGDGSLLAVAATNNVHLLEAATGRQRHILPHGEPVQSCTFSPDDRRLLVTCRDDLIRPRSAYVWDVREGVKVSPPLKHFDGIYSGSFSPDQRRAVTTGEDYIAQLWDTRTWRCYARLGHQSQVISSAFSPDGTLVATGDGQQQVRIWDALTGESAAPPIWNYFNSWTVRILPGNEYLFGASRQGQTRIWHLAPSLPAPLDTADLALLSSLLSCHRSDNSGVAIPLGTAEIEAAWTNLSVKFPTLFSISDQEIASWEARERALREKFASTPSGH
jgi:WD40 repeat protein